MTWWLRCNFRLQAVKPSTKIFPKSAWAGASKNIMWKISANSFGFRVKAVSTFSNAHNISENLSIACSHVGNQGISGKRMGWRTFQIICEKFGHTRTAETVKFLKPSKPPKPLTETFRTLLLRCASQLSFQWYLDYHVTARNADVSILAFSLW